MSLRLFVLKINGASGTTSQGKHDLVGLARGARGARERLGVGSGRGLGETDGVHAVEQQGQGSVRFSNQKVARRCDGEARSSAASSDVIEAQKGHRKGWEKRRSTR